MDHRHFSVLSHILSYIVNLALRALIIYPRSMTEYLTSWSLAEIVNDLSNVLYEIQSTWLAN